MVSRLPPKWARCPKAKSPNGSLLSFNRTIAELGQQLRDRHGAVAVWGCELEWYLTASEAICAAIWGEIGRRVVPEKGAGQFETYWEPTPDAAKLIAEVNAFKQALQQAAIRHGLAASFAAKPFKDDRGSALQIHIHLADVASGERLFEKHGDDLSSHLKHALGGLLVKLPESMPVFAPNPESRARFVAGQDAPTTVSWGANNRTVALRLPMKSGALCHIEHRVPGADADIAACMVEILNGVLHGLDHALNPPAQVFGDASDPQYGLVRL